MNKKIDFSQLGGFPATQYMTSFMQDSYRLALAAMADFVGDKVILSGMNEIGGNVTDGWISLGGELLPFTGGPLAADDTVITVETPENRVFDDGTSKQVYFTKVARIGSPGGFPYSDLKRVDTLAGHLTDTQNPHETTLDQLGFDASDNPLEDDSAKLASTKATKALADMMRVVGAGVLNIGDVPAGDPSWTVNHGLQVQGNYAVFFSWKSEGNYAVNNKMPSPVYFNCTANSFEVSAQEISGETQNLSLAWLIIKL
jgi:hypothetical protein